LPTSTATVPSSTVTITVYQTTVLSTSTSLSITTGASTIYTVTASCTTPSKCNRDNCLRAMARRSDSASSFCLGYTAVFDLPTPSYLKKCAGSTSRVSSACSCLMQPTPIPAAFARGGGQLLYGAPDYTYRAANPQPTITITAGPSTTIISNVPSSTL
jgi:hypothetical protein